MSQHRYFDYLKNKGRAASPYFILFPGNFSGPFFNIKKACFFFLYNRFTTLTLLSFIFIITSNLNRNQTQKYEKRTKNPLGDRLK
jgi:hypothetical protein